MIRLELEIEDMDYDALAELCLPHMREKLLQSGDPLGMLLCNGMSGPLARTVLAKTPKSAKEQLAAKLLNGNAARIRAAIEQQASNRGVKLQIGRLEAGTKDR